MRLFWHCIFRAASRAACTAGSNSAIKMPMIVMTTKSSTSVKPERPSEWGLEPRLKEDVPAGEKSFLEPRARRENDRYS